MPTSKTQDASTQAKRVLSEDVLSIRESLEFVENYGGRKVDRTVLHRWIHRGRRGAKLEATRIGREWITSRQALRRFIDSTRAKARKT
jgi:hypothetical protein